MYEELYEWLDAKEPTAREGKGVNLASLTPAASAKPKAAGGKTPKPSRSDGARPATSKSARPARPPIAKPTPKLPVAPVG